MESVLKISGLEETVVKNALQRFSKLGILQKTHLNNATIFKINDWSREVINSARLALPDLGATMTRVFHWIVELLQERKQYYAALAYGNLLVSLAKACTQQNDSTYPLLLAGLGLLDIVYEKLDKYQERKENLEALIDHQYEYYKEENLQIADSYHTYGILIRKMGRDDLAVNVFSKALEIKERLIRPDNKSIADTLTCMANSLNSLGEVKKSLFYHDKALNVIEGLHGPNSFEFSIALFDKAVLLLLMAQMGQQDFNFVEALFVRVSQIQLFTDNTNTEQYARTLRYLGICSFIKKDFHIAIGYLEEAINIQTRIYVEDHLEIAMTNNVLGHCYHRMNDKKTALSKIQYALNIFSKKLPLYDPRINQIKKVIIDIQEDNAFEIMFMG